MDCNNADERFTTNYVTRGIVAAELNEHLGREEFQPGDTRLTAEICQAYADDIGGLDEDDADGMGEAAWNALQTLQLAPEP